jgi:hypothetical protein
LHCDGWDDGLTSKVGHGLATFTGLFEGPQREELTMPAVDVRPATRRQAVASIEARQSVARQADLTTLGRNCGTSAVGGEFEPRTGRRVNPRVSFQSIRLADAAASGMQVR